MKQRRLLATAALVLVLVLLLSLPVPALAAVEPYVYDLTGNILTEEQGNALQDRAAEISGRYQCGVYLVVLGDSSAYGRSPASAAKAIFERYGFGLYTDNSGILLLMCMEDRDYYVYHNGYGTYAMDLVDPDAFDEAMLDQFRYDAWYEGFLAYLDACETVLAEADRSYDPSDYHLDGTLVRSRPNVGRNLAIGLAVGVVAAFITCSIGKKKMKTVHKAASAAGYTVPNSMHLRVKQDRFSHATEQRVKIETSSSSDRSSSSGGGGRPSGGSGGHGGKF